MRFSEEIYPEFHRTFYGNSMRRLWLNRHMVGRRDNPLLKRLKVYEADFASKHVQYPPRSFCESVLLLEGSWNRLIGKDW